MDLDQLRALMREHNETQVGLARLLGISADKFSKSLSGKRRFTVKEMDILRRYFGIQDEGAANPLRRLPIVGLVSAGAWREGFEQVIGWMPSPKPNLSPNCFVVVVEGDSMDLVAPSGTHIVVDPDDRRLVTRKLYVIRNADGETTFKRYMSDPARLEPCSTNPAHTTIFPGQDHFEVIGRAIMRAEDL